MNPETNNQPNESFLTTPTPKTPHPVNQVTTVSKYLALFIFLPFIGWYIGYVYAPEKVETVTPVVAILPPENNVIDDNSSTTTEMPVTTKGAGLLLSTKIISEPVTVGLKPEIGKTEIFIGTAESPQELSLGIFDGSCSVKSVDEDILNYRSVLKPAIQNVDQIISRVYCGWSDDGSETVLYTKTEIPHSYEVLHVELTGCEGRPCMAMDTVSVLKTFDSNGNETDQFFEDLKTMKIGSVVGGLTFAGVSKNNYDTEIVTLEGTFEVEGNIVVGDIYTIFKISHVDELQLSLLKINRDDRPFNDLFIEDIDKHPEYKNADHEVGWRSATTTILVDGLEIYDPSVSNAFHVTKLISVIK